MALTVAQAASQYLEELEAREGPGARASAAEALEALLGGASQAPGASPTRANPAFPRKGAAGSPVADVWTYELQAADIAAWVSRGPGGAVAGEFLAWLWNQGYLGADRYEDFRELLELPADDSVRLRRLEHRLMQVAAQQQQHLQENLMNPVLYLGLSGTPYHAELPRAELEGDLLLERVEDGALWGTVGETSVGPLLVGREAAALAREGDRLYLVLGRAAGEWRILQVHPAF